jgi:hypothetical protein
MEILVLKTETPNRYIARDTDTDNYGFGRTPLIAVTNLLTGITDTDDVLKLAHSYELAIRDIRQMLDDMIHVKEQLLDIAETNKIRSDRYALLCKEKVTEQREVIPEQFHETYPDVFWEIVTVPLGKADKAVGKVSTTKLCNVTKKVSVYRTVVELQDPDGIA